MRGREGLPGPPDWEPSLAQEGGTGPQRQPTVSWPRPKEGSGSFTTTALDECSCSVAVSRGSRQLLGKEQ